MRTLEIPGNKKVIVQRSLHTCSSTFAGKDILLVCFDVSRALWLIRKFTRKPDIALDNHHEGMHEGVSDSDFLGSIAALARIVVFLLM